MPSEEKMDEAKEAVEEGLRNSETDPDKFDPGFEVNLLSLEQQKEMDTRFTYHPPRGDKPARYNHLRARAKGLAYDILRLVPESREQSLALTKLEEAVMHANAGIARRS